MSMLKIALGSAACVALSFGAYGAQRNNGGGNTDGGGNSAANDQLSAIRDAAEARATAEQDTTTKLSKADAKKDAAAKKSNFADYKAAAKDNKNFIKDMFTKAEQAWKAKNYKEAGYFYQAVAQATAPGTEDMVDTAHERINVDMENLAKDHIKASDDAGLQRDFMKQIDELSVVTKDFVITKAKEDAQRRLTSLKSRSEIVGYVDYAQAELYLNEGKLTDGLAALNAILANPRYENSIPALKAARKLDEFNKSEDTRAKVRTEFVGKADKEAPQLLNAARNYNSNNMPKSAREKLQTLLDKYPGTTYADEAKKLLEEIAK